MQNSDFITIVDTLLTASLPSPGPHRKRARSAWLLTDAFTPLQHHFLLLDHIADGPAQPGFFRLRALHASQAAPVTGGAAEWNEPVSLYASHPGESASQEGRRATN